MKTIIVATRKGGVGKTTLAVSLAFYFAETKRRVLLIDLDGQQNASKTLAAHVHPNAAASQLFVGPVSVDALGDPAVGNSITVVRADQHLDDLGTKDAETVVPPFVANMRAFAAKFDVCVIDTPPSAGVAGVAAMIAGHAVVSPIDAETYSIDGIQSTLQMVARVQKRWNPALQFAGIVLSRVDGHSPSQVATVKRLVSDYGHLVLPAVIKESEAVAAVAGSGRPVWREVNEDGLPTYGARKHGKAMLSVFKAIERKVFP
jgi:chromosome partitioning protein